MADWDYQIRINLGSAFAQAARTRPDDPSLQPLNAVLKKYDAVIKNQFDAFADYCRDVERQGETDSALYKGTKATIEKPGKREQYATRFTIYADGGKEVYAREIAEALEADLQPLRDSGMVTKISKIPTDPAKNPQPGRDF